MPEQRVNILVYRPDGTLIAQYLLGDGEHLIGRDINCAVYLDSEHISSNHAKLHLSADGIYIEDLNSTSGTYLDGVTVRGKLRIKPGQVLQVGDLTVDLQPESVDNVGPGSRLGGDRYTLIRLLGRGGMGEVWLAKDEQLDEEVALKKLPPEVAADAMALSDMRREVQKSRGLSHPNIIRIHDLLQQPGEDPLISLEYVDGRDLTAIAATKTNGIFSWEEIKDWMFQLISALEYAHYEKIVHRDLKPANIMITRDGRLKLADFGIAATLVDSLSRSSMEGYVSGTTLYMSPQQMEGEVPQTTDDIYAFGAMVYELLSSKPPFYTGNVEHQVLNVTPKLMDQRLAEFGFTNEIPEYANHLVMACLAKEPEGRPQGMGAIREWIESEGAAKEVMPKPTTKTVKKQTEPAEGRRTNYAVVAVALALVVGLGIWLKGQIEGLGSGQLPVQVSKLPKEKAKGNGPGETNTPTAQPTNSTTAPEVPLEPPTKNGATTNPEPVKPKPPVTQPVKPTNPATTGKERLLWEFVSGGPVISSPAIGSDGTVYVGSDDKKLYAINGKSGVKLWEFKTGSVVISSPAIGSDGTVYVGSYVNKLYAFKTDSKGPAKSPWPMRGQNPQHTGRASATKTSSATPNSPEAKAAIEAATRKAAGKPTGTLTKADLAKVTRLILHYKKLTDVKELEKLDQLRYLDLLHNKLTEVKALEKLTDLKSLDLRDNPDLTKAQIGELQKALPNCKISSNPKK